MNRVSVGALFCVSFALSGPLWAQSTQPTTQPATQPSEEDPDAETGSQTSQPATQPATQPIIKQPVEVPRPVVEPPTLITPKGPGEDGAFTLVERPFPEEIHARRYQFFQMDGYFRLRADRFVQPDLGLTLQNGGPVLGPQNLPIFGLPAPIELNQQNIGENFGSEGKVYATSNLRLRMDPTLNVSETVRVRAQLDVLDNVVLGSTPGFFPEVGGLGRADGDAPDIFGSSQVPFGNTIVARRAWAEVQIPYGELRFGRMGWHFGMGLLSNDGNDIDANFGDTVDRVSLTFKLADYLITGAFDFGGTGLIAEQPGAGQLGQPFNVSQVDNIQQYVVSAMRLYTRQEEEKLKKRGEKVLQYGAQAIFRNQTGTTEFNPPDTDPNLAVLADRRAFTGTLDLWTRFVWKDIYLEAEAVGIYGNINCLFNAPPGNDAGRCQESQPNAVTLLAGGFAARGRYNVPGGQWSLGGEIGAASGDPQASFSLALQSQSNLNPAINGTFTSFLFDRDYRVDLILFRELLSTVTGAAYIKPVVEFRPFSQVTLRGSGIYSLALAPNDNLLGVSANAPLSGQSALGLEFNLDAEYKTQDGFFAALSWGLLIPQAGLNAFSNQGVLLDAKNAQAFRLRMGVVF